MARKYFRRSLKPYTPFSVMLMALAMVSLLLAAACGSDPTPTPTATPTPTSMAMEEDQPASVPATSPTMEDLGGGSPELFGKAFRDAIASSEFPPPPSTRRRPIWRRARPLP